MDHMKKHLIHGLFLLAMAVAVSVSDFTISAVALVGVVVLSIVLLEVGLWLIHRRHQPADVAH